MERLDIEPRFTYKTLVFTSMPFVSFIACLARRSRSKRRLIAKVYAPMSLLLLLLLLFLLSSKKPGDSSWSRACSFSSSSSRTSLASKNTSSSSSSSRGAESRLQKQQHVLPLVGADRIQNARKGLWTPHLKGSFRFFATLSEGERERERRRRVCATRETFGREFGEVRHMMIHSVNVYKGKEAENGRLSLLKFSFFFKKKTKRKKNFCFFRLSCVVPTFFQKSTKNIFIIDLMPERERRKKGKRKRHKIVVSSPRRFS